MCKSAAIIVMRKDQYAYVLNATQVLEAMDEEEPPLVLEYNGTNHYSAYRREDLPEHDGYNMIDGLKRYTKTQSSSAPGPSTSRPSQLPPVASPSASTRAVRKRKPA